MTSPACVKRRFALAAPLVATLFATQLTAQARGAATVPSVLLRHVAPNGDAAASPTDAGGREPAACAADLAIAAGPIAGQLAPAGARLASLLSGTAELPLCGRRALVLSARGEASTRIAPLQLGSWRALTTVALPTKTGSVWLSYTGSATAVDRPSLATGDSGRTERPGPVFDRDMLHEISLGASRRIGTMMLSISAGGARGIVRDEVTAPTRTVIDSVWNDTSGWVPDARTSGGGRTARALASRWMTGEISASWLRERFALAATVGGWMPGANSRGSGWGELELARRIQPSVWLVAGAGVRPDVSRVAAVPGRYSMVGLRFAWAARRVPADASPPIEPARAFTITPGSAGSYDVALRAPGAKHVEISGDFTRWAPMTLAPAAGGWWITTVRLAPGAYRVNVRVDEGPWYPPPGTTAVADDFGGSAGLVVVPER